ncbi:MAG: SPOR domain-containing protein, partial [Candidatus Sericytochromatia bacterium]|nr:SPOR domain-containing protein [Candidatus Tanganyikabacteria bacterium]
KPAAPAPVAAVPADPEPVVEPAEPAVKRVASKRKQAQRRRAREGQVRRWRTAQNWAWEGGHGGGYTVQVGAFSHPSNAERLIASLKGQGFPAYGTGGGRGGTTMVHAGQFHVRSNVVDTRQKANQLANQFRLAGWSPRVVPLSGGQYVLHLGTFGAQEQASSLVADLNAKGLFATVSGRVGARSGVVVTQRSAGGGPNRVWVGRFGSRSEAEAMASRLRSEVGAAIVVRR